MKLIWTRSKSPLSVLIRWALGTDCSHFAFVFNSPSGGLMFEANLLGTHPRFFKNALKHMEVVHQIDVELPLAMEDKVWDTIVDELDGKGYDFKAFIYFSWRALLLKIFKRPLPDKNKWQDPSRPLCVAIVNAVQHIGIKLPDDFDPEMRSPHDLLTMIESVIAANKAKVESIP